MVLQAHIDEIQNNVNDLKIEDQIVENSNKEIEYLEQKHEESKKQHQDIETEIVSKKDACEFNKQSDLGAIIQLKAMNELREVELQKNMVDQIVYQLNKDNWLSELVVSFHITNNNSAVESFSKEYVDKVFNKAQNIVWRRHFNENSEKEFIIPKAKIAESEDKASRQLQAANEHLGDFKRVTKDLATAQIELDRAIKEEVASKTKFSSSQNQFQATINRFNSKKFQKANAKPKIIKAQQTMIDRLEKEIEVSGIKEKELKTQINDIEEDM